MHPSHYFLFAIGLLVPIALASNPFSAFSSPSEIAGEAAKNVTEMYGAMVNSGGGNMTEYM